MSGKIYHTASSDPLDATAWPGVDPDGYMDDGRPYWYGTDLNGKDVVYYPAGVWSNEGISLASDS